MSAVCCLLQGDCLHYRLPAAPDAWAYVLFNLLLVYAPCTPQNSTGAAGLGLLLEKIANFEVFKTMKRVMPRL